MRTTSWRNWCWKLGLASSLAMGGAIAASSFDCALAQITPDATLGAERSIVTPTTINGIPSDRIDGGAQRGANLFHSFREFNVDSGRGAYFTNPAGILNIISRVTGSNLSNIFGKLGVLGNANLFLINPNGIIFGSNATLDVSGSFVASTASSLKFADGTEFNATAPQTTPLLTISVPIGLQFRENPGFIRNQSQATDSSGQVVGLQVQPGQTLALVGGDVSLGSGDLQAPGGRVELGGLAGTGTVGLFVDSDNLRLSFPAGVVRADVSLDDGADVNVRAGGGGSIAINAQNLNLAGESRLLAGIASELGSVDSKAGDIEINATGAITLTGGSSITNRLLGGALGKGGDVNVVAGSFSVTSGAELTTRTSGQGDAGNVRIQANGPVSLDGVGSNGFPSGIGSQVNPGALGKGGGVNVTASSLSVTNGAELVAVTFGQGDAGNVRIQTSGPVSLDGVGSNGFPSVIGSQVEAGAVGNGGEVSITTRSLSLTNGAQLGSSTSGQGDAGGVRINASGAITLDGSSVFSQVEAGAVGNGGSINITDDSLSLTNGAQLVTSTAGQGNAGNVRIQANGLVSFDGVGSDGYSSGVFSDVDLGGVGKGGEVSITAGSFSLTNGALITTTTVGEGDAGNVRIQTGGPITFDGVGSNGFRSGVFSTVEVGAVGNGSDVNITSESLSLTNGGSLSASTFGQGKAGNIQVDAADSVNVSGSGFNGRSSGLYTSTEQGASGQGGEITVNTAAMRVQNGAVVDTQTLNDSDGGSVTIKAKTFEAATGGQVLTTTGSGGRAGNIILKVANSVTLSGSDPTYTNRLAQFGSDVVNNQGAASGLFANTAPSSTGNSGTISIDPIKLTLSDGASIAVSSLGQGNGGSIQIHAGSVTLDRGSSLSATTASTEGGNINLQAQNLLLRNGGQISTTANAGGNGGKITITTPFVIAVPQENSKISANAFKGNGGTVTINASGIFGFQQPAPNQSQITASSTGGGLNGVVTLNTPEIDPSRGLVALPVIFADVSRQIAQGCGTGNRTTTGRFIMTGRGGLPPNPNDTLSSDAILDDTRLPTTTVRKKQSATVATTPPSAPETVPIVPATGVVFNGNDEVTLIASAPTATLQIPWLSPTACHAYAS